MIASVDESVGRVMAVLDELKLAENTVLIFMSDNGGVGGYIREGLKQGGDITDNAPLRSGKGSLYEGGTRVPFIVRWPGHVKPGGACEVPAIHVDVYPTLAALAGASLPEKQIQDGVSLAPLLRAPGAPLAREAICQHFPGYLGAGVDQWRTTPVTTLTAGDWKLMEFLEDGRLELYNLREDLGETRNLAAAIPERTKALHAKLVAWRADVKAPMPEAHCALGRLCRTSTVVDATTDRNTAPNSRPDASNSGQEPPSAGSRVATPSKAFNSACGRPSLKRSSKLAHRRGDTTTATPSRV